MLWVTKSFQFSKKPKHFGCENFIVGITATSFGPFYTSKKWLKFSSLLFQRLPEAKTSNSSCPLSDFWKMPMEAKPASAPSSFLPIGEAWIELSYHSASIRSVLSNGTSFCFFAGCWDSLYCIRIWFSPHVQSLPPCHLPKPHSPQCSGAQPIHYRSRDQLKYWLLRPKDCSKHDQRLEHLNPLLDGSI